MRNAAAGGPPERAVSLARAWLVGLGGVWLASGIAFLVLVNDPLGYWGWAMIALGTGHFVAARYASARLAVFFAFFGP
jgi:hypothetical protein